MFFSNFLFLNFSAYLYILCVRLPISIWTCMYTNANHMMTKKHKLSAHTHTNEYKKINVHKRTHIQTLIIYVHVECWHIQIKQTQKSYIHKHTYKNTHYMMTKTLSNYPHPQTQKKQISINTHTNIRIIWWPTHTQIIHTHKNKKNKYP